MNILQQAVAKRQGVAGPEWKGKDEIYRKIISMDRAVTFQEFSELKDWMISHFTTKQDLERFATKEEVLPRLGRLEQDVAVLKYDMRIVKQDVAELKQEVAGFKGETLTRFDKVVGFLEKLDQERIFTHEAILRLEREQHSTHEAILRIEEKLSK